MHAPELDTVYIVSQIDHSLDPALCLLSHSEFKAELHAHIAIALQRGNVAIMIEDSIQTRMKESPHARRRCAGAKRALPPAMAAKDDSRRGVREDGAWLMRGSPPRVVEVSGVGDASGESGCARAQSGALCIASGGVASGIAADGGVESGVDGCGVGAVDMVDSHVLGVCDSVAMDGMSAAAALLDPSAGTWSQSSSAPPPPAAAALMLECQESAAPVTAPPAVVSAAAAVGAQCHSSSGCARGDVSDVCMSDSASADSAVDRAMDRAIMQEGHNG